MNTRLSILPLVSLIIFSFACGGGSSTYEDSSNRTDTGARTIDLEGAIDDSTLPSKPRWAGGNSLTFTGNIYDINNSQQQWLMNIDDSENYTAAIIRRSDIALEIYRDNSLVLSRVMSEGETLVNTRAKVNSITHLQASIARALQRSQGGELTSHLENVNLTLFEKTVINESEYTLDSLAENLGDVKVIISTYAHLFRSPSSSGFSSLLFKLNQALDESSTSSLISAWLDVADNLSTQDELDAYASAHEGAKNSGISSANLIFSELSDRFNSTPLLSAIEEAKASPVFGSNVDILRDATPGALFQYTFPRATTEDILGITSYNGAWLGEEPMGTWMITSDEGRTLHFLPDSSDIGKSFPFGLTVDGGNGKTTSASNIIVEVKTPTLTPMPRKSLSLRPLVGPLVDDQFLYLISISDIGHEFYLQKFAQDSIQASNGEDSTLANFSWTLPTSVSEVTDILLHLNTLYISTGEASYGFDASFQTISPPDRTPTYVNDEMESSAIALFQGQLFHFHSSGNVQTTDLSLSGNVISSLPTSFFTSIGNSTFLSGNSTIYSYDQNLLFAAGPEEHNAYFLNSSGNLELLDSFSPEALSPAPNSSLLTGLPLTYIETSDNSLSQWLPLNDSIEEISLPRSEIVEKQNPHGVSANLLLSFNADPTTGTNQIPSYSLQGNSLSANAYGFTESSEIPLESLHFGNNAEGISLKIQSTAGIGTETSSSWIYSIGNDGIGSDNWFIQAHLLEPGD